MGDKGTETFDERIARLEADLRDMPRFSWNRLSVIVATISVSQQSLELSGEQVVEELRKIVNGMKPL